SGQAPGERACGQLRVTCLRDRRSSRTALRRGVGTFAGCAGLGGANRGCVLERCGRVGRRDRAMGAAMKASVEVGLSAVIVAVTDEVPRVLTVRRAHRPPALPYGPLEPHTDRTLELALRRWVTDLTGLNLGYVEQLYTFGDRDRAGAETMRRIVSVAYL